jgi:hypothetical protein
MARFKGIAVHFRFGSHGYPEAATDTELLGDSIETILKTIPGQRVYRPTFGCYVSRLLFANIGQETAVRARTEAMVALSAWEPRVIVDEIRINPVENKIELTVLWRPKQDRGTQFQRALTFGA